MAGSCAEGGREKGGREGGREGDDKLVKEKNNYDTTQAEPSTGSERALLCALLQTNTHACCEHRYDMLSRQSSLTMHLAATQSKCSGSGGHMYQPVTSKGYHLYVAQCETDSDHADHTMAHAHVGRCMPLIPLTK